MMNLPSYEAKNCRPMATLQGPGGCEISELIMQQKQTQWQVANAQAKQVAKLKNKQAKRRQIALWCEIVKKALKGGE